MDYLFKIISQLAAGFYWTLCLAVVASVISLIVGFIAGLVKQARLPLFRQLINGYVYLIRGTPFLLLIFIIYYVLPFFGIRLSSFTAGIIGLVLHESAYIIEIVRSAIEAIDKGQNEAAHALGLNYFQEMYYVILPQALKLMLPPLAGQLVLLIKSTALISLIGLTDVTRMGKQLSQRGENPFLIFTLVGAFYFIICYPVIKVSDRLERSV